MSLQKFELKVMPNPIFFSVCFLQWTPTMWASTEGKGAQSQAGKLQSWAQSTMCLHAQLIVNLSPSQASPWVCTPRLTEAKSCALHDALRTDKAQAAPSMRSHLKLVINKHIIDLLFISYRDHKTFSLRKPAKIQRREMLCKSCFHKTLCCYRSPKGNWSICHPYQTKKQPK